MSITPEKEYFSNLSLLYNVNPPAYASLPAAEILYNIDLNTRKIDAPKVLSIEKDHKSNIVYFSVNRFMDYMDLALTNCIIQYNIEREVKGKKVKKTYFYPVPFFDIYQKATEGKIIFPWALDASVTSASGIVEFSIVFFKIGTKINDNGNAEYIYTYNLNTLPARSEVIKGIEKYEITDEEEKILSDYQYFNLWAAINDIKKDGVGTELFWTILPGTFVNPDVDDSEITEELGNIQSEIENNLKKLDSET